MLSRLARAPRLGLSPARLIPIATSRPPVAFSPWQRPYSQKPTPPSSESPKEPADTTPTSKSTKSPDSEPIPFHKLPDLTQGIPSTLQDELDQALGKSRDPNSLQKIEQPAYERRGGGGDEYVSTNERNRKWWTRFMLYTAAGGALTSVLYLGRNWDHDIEAQRHPDAPNGFSPNLWYQRVKARLDESRSYYQDPEFDKLLPDPDPSFERPYTLCLSLDDLLIHHEWSRQHGWRVAKRPGVDYFIRYLGQYYELVLFTTNSFAMGEPLVRKLDPFRFIMWPLYREATKFEDGEIVKVSALHSSPLFPQLIIQDLSYLNRDLSKVIIIDSQAKHVRKQPENAIVLDPWKGDRSDKELVSLIPFLEYIHTMQYADVRKVLKSFDGTHIPTEFARREAIARKEFNAQLATRQKHSKPSGFGALGGLLGLNPSNMSMTVAPDGEQNPNEAFAQGKMLQDIARERGQRNYELLEKEIRENGEKWLREEKEAMEKAQKEAMDSMFGSFSTFFTPKKE